MCLGSVRPSYEELVALVVELRARIVEQDAEIADLGAEVGGEFA